SVRHVMTSGEALSYELQKRFFACLDAELHNLYGPTEAAIEVTYWECDPDSHLSFVPIGRPIANTRIYVLDQHLQPVPIGVAGELHIGGVQVARGYHNRPDLTAEKFIPNPFVPGERLYKTGDLARFLPDGNVQYMGRLDYQVKIRGQRVEMGEIEEVLMQQTDVRDAVAVVREDVPGDQRLVAYLVVHEAQSFDANELRNFLKKRLPDYMVPAQYMLLEELPLTPSGKVDRKSLPIPDGAIMATSREYVAPTTPTEQLLAGLWEELLSVEQISVHDSFFELGGHSLLATRVVSQIRKSFAVEIPVRALFEHATISELAVLIDRELHTNPGAQAPSILPEDRKRDIPLSFAQERLFVLDQMLSNKTVYNMPFAVRMRGALEVSALESALQEIISRHESLRTTFVLQDGIPMQIITNSQPVALRIVDLQELPTAEREAQVRHLLQAEVEQPFDLQTGPLVRFLLIQLDDAEHVLMANMHHIVSDGWSMGIFTEEFMKIYLAIVHQMEPMLPEMPVQYADFAIWQRDWLQGEVLDAQMAFWKKQLGGELPVLEMPTDRPRPPVQTYRGASEAFTVPRHLTKALNALSRQQGATLFMTMLSAYQTLLHRYTGQADIVVGTPIAGRNRKETEGLIGFFINTLVLRTSFEGNPTFTELLHQVRETSLEAFANQDVPFEKLVDELKLQRDPSRTPLFQTMFILQNTPFEEVKLPGLTLLPVEFDNPTAKFDLSIELSERGEELVGLLNYNTDLFDRATIARLAQHYLNLLQGIADDAKQFVSVLPILTEAERHQLVGEWNDTMVEYPQDVCLHQLFEQQVARTPDAVAVVFEEQELTYRELNEQANRLAHYLQKQQVGPEVLVGVCMERSLEMVISLYGILKAGGAYVPIDPTYPSDRLSYLLEDSQIQVLLTQEKWVDTLPNVSSVPIICLDHAEELLAGERTENLPSAATVEHAAYMIYTSGSTGKPKGVVNTHKGIVNRLLWM
ncbi:MAG: condensation domain-containing protein, partial [Tumebacillaceae bacterium]